MRLGNVALQLIIRNHFQCNNCSLFHWPGHNVWKTYYKISEQLWENIDLQSCLQLWLINNFKKQCFLETSFFLFYNAMLLWGQIYSRTIRSSFLCRAPSATTFLQKGKVQEREFITGINYIIEVHRTDIRLFFFSGWILWRVSISHPLVNTKNWVKLKDLMPGHMYVCNCIQSTKFRVLISI